MTTIVPFIPAGQAPSPPFSFTATLDGANYNVAVTQLYFSKDWYITITDLDGNTIVSEPMSGSPTGAPLAGLSWSQTTGLVTATTESPHGLRIGLCVELSLAGNSPSALNGRFTCLVTGPSTFTFPLSPNPGQTTALGIWSYDINLVGGYFTTSSLVYRTQAQQFEINP